MTKTGIKRLSREQAVSPVVGVMLMIVVTVIIAAVVSGMAGGMASNTKKAPSVSMDVEIANNGYWSGSHFSAKVTSIDEMIPTKDLKIVTHWAKTLPNGTRITDGATILPGVPNTHLQYSPYGACIQYTWWNWTSPQGFGPGVPVVHGITNTYPYAPVIMQSTDCGSKWGPDDLDHITNASWFGNFNFVLGTTLWAQPFGEGTSNYAGAYKSNVWTMGYGVNASSQWNYTFGHDSRMNGADFQPLSDPTDLNSGSVDQMMGVLGYHWNELRAGDIVNVQIIHIPTGKTIFTKDVAVTEG